MENYCIFACGGSGTRMGSDIPKQFLRIGGKTILQLSMEKVASAVPGVRMVIALPAAWREWWLEECRNMNIELRQSLVEGGITRYHSVKNALEKVPESAIVAVHDAVRPFVSEALVAEAFAHAAEYGSAVPVIPVTDTLKVLRKDENGNLEEIPGASADRSVMFGAQTPQVFSSDMLKEAYRQPFDTAFTDDASVVARTGVKIHYIPGEKYNIKLTTPEDMLLADLLMI